MRTANPNIEIFSSEKAARRFYDKQSVGSLLQAKSGWFVDKKPASHPESAATAWPDSYKVLDSKTGVVVNQQEEEDQP